MLPLCSSDMSPIAHLWEMVEKPIHTQNVHLHVSAGYGQVFSQHAVSSCYNSPGLRGSYRILGINPMTLTLQCVYICIYTHTH